MTIQGAGEPVLSDNKTCVIRIACIFWMFILEGSFIWIGHLHILAAEENIKVGFWMKRAHLCKVILLHNYTKHRH